MANTIDTAFIKQFESDVHLAYQRMGSKLRNTVRSSNISGSVARFQKIVQRYSQDTLWLPEARNRYSPKYTPRIVKSILHR